MRNNDIINTIIGIAGLVGIGYGLCAHTKLAKVSERLDTSIDRLAYDMEIDIPEELIKKADEKAGETEAKRVVGQATKEAVNKIEKDIHKQVLEAVNSEYDGIKDKVLKEATESAAKIDADRVRRDVEKAAKEAALEKFDDNLDNILENFNETLTNTTKIYSSIREAVAKSSNSGSGFVVRLD